MESYVLDGVKLDNAKLEDPPFTGNALQIWTKIKKLNEITKQLSPYAPH